MLVFTVFLSSVKTTGRTLSVSDVLFILVFDHLCKINMAKNIYHCLKK